MVLDYYLQKRIQDEDSPLIGKDADPQFLKFAASIDHIIFTSLSIFFEGNPRLSQYFAVEDQTFASKQQILQIAASLANCSDAPLLLAVTYSAKEHGIPVREMETDKIGEDGVTGRLDKTWYVLGDESVMQSERIELGVTSRALMQQLEMNGKQIIFLAQRQPKRLLGIFACEYGLLPDSERIISQLKEFSVTPIVLTNQRTRPTKSVTAKLGIEEVNSELSEDQKRNMINSFQKKYPQSAFIALPEQQSLVAKVSFPLLIGPPPLHEEYFQVQNLQECLTLLKFARDEIEKARKIFFWCKL